MCTNVSKVFALEEPRDEFIIDPASNSNNSFQLIQIRTVEIAGHLAEKGPASPFCKRLRLFMISDFTKILKAKYITYKYLLDFSSMAFICNRIGQIIKIMTGGGAK